MAVKFVNCCRQMMMIYIIQKGILCAIAICPDISLMQSLPYLFIEAFR